MLPESEAEFTKLLQQAAEGSGAADVVPLVYEQLRSLAHQQLAAEQSGHTLQPTALVHEAF